MTYYMPTRIIEDTEVIKKNGDIIAGYGKKALIVTGKTSAKKSGALDDVIAVLQEHNMEHVLFDGMVENPPLEVVVEGAKVGEGCDMIIAIGGGSPIDGAKAVGILINNPELGAYEAIFQTSGLQSLPLIAIPTTAGTGTETTPYAIITDHVRKTKMNFSSKVFPEIAFIDVQYFLTMPLEVRNNTCVDALTHMVESYMNINANFYSDSVNEKAFALWGKSKEALKATTITETAMLDFIHASTLAGVAISQTGTSLPHGMGYALTYEKGMAHGKANGVLTAAYLEQCHNTDKVANILSLLGLTSLAELDAFIKEVLGGFEMTEEEINRYADDMMANTAKLKNHPDPVNHETIVGIYKRAISGVR